MAKNKPSSFKAPVVEIAEFQPPAKIVFDANALERIEEATGENSMAPNFWKSVFEKMSIKTVKLLVWAGCASHQPEREITEIGSQIWPGNFAAVENAIVKAFQLQQPEPEPRPIDAAEAAADASQ